MAVEIESGPDTLHATCKSCGRGLKFTFDDIQWSHDPDDTRGAQSYVSCPGCESAVFFKIEPTTEKAREIVARVRDISAKGQLRELISRYGAVDLLGKMSEVIAEEGGERNELISGTLRMVARHLSLD